MNSNRIIIIAFIWTLCLSPGHSQIINFEHIGLEEGLSQVSVMGIAQDTLGNMWLGTRNGINRYDGTSITTYTTHQEERLSIPDNQIKKIISQGNKVWFQSPDNLTCFSVDTEEFLNFPMAGINAFCVFENKIWVGTETEIFRLNNASNQFEKIKVQFSPEEKVTTMIEHAGRLLIGTDHHVWQFHPSLELQILIDKTQVKCLFTDSDLNLWVGTYDDGLYKRASDGKIQHYKGDQELSNGFVRCIEEDDNGNIWVGTFKGLDVIKKDLSIEHYNHDKSYQSGLSHNSIWSLFKDKDGAIWVGTYFGGVNLFHPTKNLFNYYPENTNNNKSINFRVVGRITEDHLHNLWICTEGGGLNYLDRKRNVFEYYVHDTLQNSISHNNLKALLNQGDSILWIGTHRGGLNKLYLKTKEFAHFLAPKNNPDSLQIKDISSIISYNNGFLLSGVNSVLFFNPRLEVFSDFFPTHIKEQIKGRVISLLIDQNDQLWIGTEYSGLFRYSLRTKKFHSFKNDPLNKRSLVNDFIYQVFQDHFARIWIGTADGLNLYQPASNDFDRYYTSDGLSGNIIFNIAESRYGDLILATDKGISFFNVKKGTFKNVTSANGLPLKELNEGGLYITSDGHIYVSGIDGLASFNEKDLLNRVPQSLPMITRLSINNKIVSPTSHPDILKRSIMNTSNMDLKHFHTNITIHFSDMTFTKSNKQALEFKLEGFDTEWTKASDQNEATYTNLDDGQFIFKVRNINYPALERSLTIVMNPPIYLTKTAYLFYFSLALLIILFLNKQYLNRNRLQDKLKLEQKKHEQVIQLNQSKLRFFTNISHEFRTPLTLIAGQIELLLEHQNLQPSTYKKILNVHKNTVRLKSLISELLDFRKQEQGHLKIKASNQDFIAFIQEIYLSFFELAKHTNISYKLNHDLSHYSLWFDQSQLEKVFYNLLSNAFKFTQENGQIMINIYEENLKIIIEIINTGVGMSKENINKIFDRFYQLDNLSDNDEQGTGIGLALSKGILEAHKGTITVCSTPIQTTFTVAIPIGKGHFNKDELQTVNLKLPLITDIEMESPTSHIGSVETILIVEDNTEVREFLHDLLSPLFDIITASDGKEGFEKAQELQPTLILSDVLMPNMSGIEMCIRLKTDLSTSHIPVIMLTARTAAEHKIEGLETGADDYITKPFNTKILIARINNIINNRKAIQQKFILDPLATTKKIAKNKIDKDFLEKAQSSIIENISNPNYDIAAFARDMTLGRTNLFSKIKGITGQTPNELIMTMRLNKAVQMLTLQPDITIAEIAYACGFSNPHYFSRSFKKHFGASPSNYIKDSQQ